MRTSSKSSPPRCVSPLVEIDAEHAVGYFEHRHVERTAAEVEDADVFFALPFETVASDAAVGSLMMRATSRPAIWPASLVACRWASLK